MALTGRARQTTIKTMQEPFRALREVTVEPRAEGPHRSTRLVVRFPDPGLSVFEGKLLRANSRHVRVSPTAPVAVDGDAWAAIELTLLARQGVTVLREVLAACLEAGVSSFSVQNPRSGVTVTVTGADPNSAERWRTVESVCWS